MNDKVVKVGQLWQDNDPRIASYWDGARRLLRVIAVGQPGPNTARVVSWYEEPDGTGGWRRKTTDRPSVVKLRRFVPSTTGYRLLEEPPVDLGVGAAIATVVDDVRGSAEERSDDPSNSSDLGEVS